MLVRAWLSIDVVKACELGYRVVRLIEVWDFPESSSHLFKGYIDTFLKIKQEASGWPSWCQTEAQKRQYIREYEEKEGIKLDYAKIKKNPGLRSLAKLMLNSFCKYHVLPFENVIIDFVCSKTLNVFFLYLFLRGEIRTA